MPQMASEAAKAAAPKPDGRRRAAKSMIWALTEFSGGPADFVGARHDQDRDTPRCDTRCPRAHPAADVWRRSCLSHSCLSHSGTEHAQASGDFGDLVLGHFGLRTNGRPHCHERKDRDAGSCIDDRAGARRPRRQDRCSWRQRCHGRPDRARDAPRRRRRTHDHSGIDRFPYSRRARRPHLRHRGQLDRRKDHWRSHGTLAPGGQSAPGVLDHRGRWLERLAICGEAAADARRGDVGRARQSGLHPAVLIRRC
ncbi:hypothetical protein ACVWXN_006457 [Bradyrhizobium sp. i1.4.4]